MEIIKTINTPVPSNTYIVFEKTQDNCIVIDPGSKYETELIEILDKLQLKPQYILLTHEHFDHIWGCKKLQSLYNAKIICSETCKIKIAKEQNYYNLLYYGDSTKYAIKNVFKTIEELNFKMNFNNLDIKFILTPGHSSCSICIQINDILFTGDTILKGFHPLILKRHEGSKKDFSDSVKKVFNIISEETIVYPGHGDTFKLKEVKKFYENYIS